jgi:pimeloyl-ACP methyl ester carboxylesterase
MTAAARPVVFIHGLWIHSKAWQPWIELYRSEGYDPLAPGWPGDSADVESTRSNPAALANKGLDDITAGYAEIIDNLSVPPIVVGHSFGGLVAQRLLADERALAAVAIDPGQIKGVKPVPFAQIRSGFAVLSKPGNRKRAVSLSRKQFRYGFGNALSQAESDELFAKWTIPGPGKPLFEASTANFKKHSPAGVNTRRTDRGPLLIIGGGRDHTVPQVVAKAAYKLYSKSDATTDYLAFPDRGHSLVFDHGWRAIADATLAWLRSQGL